MDNSLREKKKASVQLNEKSNSNSESTDLLKFINEFDKMCEVETNAKRLQNKNLKTTLSLSKKSNKKATKKANLNNVNVTDTTKEIVKELKEDESIIAVTNETTVGESNLNVETASKQTNGQINKKETTQSKLNERKHNKSKKRTNKLKVTKLNSVLNKPLVDPLEEDRQITFNKLDEKFNVIMNIKNLSKAELASSISARKKQIYELIDTLNSEAKKLSRKVPYSTMYKNGTTIDDMTKKIETLELQNASSDIIQNQYQELITLHCIENNKEFFNNVKKYELKYRDGLGLLDKQFEIVKDNEMKARILARLNKYGKSITADNLFCETITNKKNVFDKEINKRLENNFNIVINETAGILTVWGNKENLSHFVKWLNNVDITEQTIMKFDPNFLGVLIGKGGNTITSLESESNAIIQHDNDGIIIIHGSKDEKKKAIELINYIKKNQEDKESNLIILTSIAIGKFILNEQKQAIEKIEKEHNCIIRVVFDSVTNNCSISVKCNTNLIDTLKIKIENDLIDCYSTYTKTITAKAASRLFKQQTSQIALEIYKEFHKFITNHQIYFVRSGSNSLEITFIYKKSLNGDAIQSQLAKILNKAEYTTATIKIDANTLRLFTNNTKKSLEEQTECTIKIIARENLILIIGDELKLKNAIEIINKFINDNAYSFNYNFFGDETKKQLLSGKAKLLKELECTHNVSLKIDHSSNSLNILGNENNVKLVCTELDSIAMDNGELAIRNITLDKSTYNTNSLEIIKQLNGYKEINYNIQSDDEEKITLTLIGSQEFIYKASVYLESNCSYNIEATTAKKNEVESSYIFRQQLTELDFPSL